MYVMHDLVHGGINKVIVLEIIKLSCSFMCRLGLFNMTTPTSDQFQQLMDKIKGVVRACSVKLTSCRRMSPQARRTQRNDLLRN